MKRRASHPLPVPASTVWTMVRDVDSHLAKAALAGHRDLEVLAHDLADDHVHVEMKRTVSIELPGFARKVMEPTQRVRTIDDWYDRGDGTYGGTFTTDVRGAPFELNGVTHVEPDGDDACTYTLEIEVKVKVPVIGRKLERWSADDVDRQIADEFAAADAWLAEHA